MKTKKQNKLEMPLIPEELIKIQITHSPIAINNRIKLSELICIAYRLGYEFKYFHIHFNEFCNYFYIWNSKYKFALTFYLNENIPRIWFNCPKCLDECFMHLKIESTIEQIEKEIKSELKKHNNHCKKYHDLNKDGLK